MLPSKVVPLSCLLLILLVSVEFSSCRRIAGPDEPEDEFTCSPVSAPKKTFPDIEALTDDQVGYEMNLEVNFLDMSEFYEEYYENAAEAGRFTQRRTRAPGSPVQTQTITYMLKTNEAFIVRDYDCNVTKVEKGDNVPFAADWAPEALLSDEAKPTPYGYILGPSAMFKHGLDLHLIKDRFSYIGQTKLRGYPKVNVWRDCFTSKSGVQTMIKYYFLDNEEGGLQVPLRMEANTNSNGVFATLDYIVAKFKPITKRNRTPVRVPTGVGCQRLFSDHNSPAPVDFLELDHQLEFEVVTTAIWLNGFNISSSVVSAEVVFDREARLLSFTQTIINLNAMDDEDFRFYVKKVVDINEQVTYTINERKDSCDITPHASSEGHPWGKLPGFQFLDGSVLNVLDPEFWSVKSPIQYMGRGRERGIPVIIYEETFADKFQDEKGDNMPVVVTRYFLGKDVDYEGLFLVRGAPVKLMVKVFNKDKTDLTRMVTVNIHSFQAGLLTVDKPQKFDIMDCFEGPEQSNWFQTVFPVEVEEMMDLLAEERSLENAFRSAMSEVGPHRLPRVYLDYDTNNIYITALLLDRPPFDKLYTLTPRRQVDQETGTGTLVGSIANCAQDCTWDQFCAAFSYCSSFECDFFIADPQTPGDEVRSVENAECSLYQMRLPKNGSPAGPLINRVILDELKIDVDSFAFEIGFNLNNDTKSLRAVQLVTDVEPGFLTDLKKRKGANEDFLEDIMIGYQVTAKKTKLSLLSIDKKVLKSVPMSLKDCIGLCNDDLECRTISFCSTNYGQCVLTSYDGDDIKEYLTLDDLKCSVISKRYMSGYDTHPTYGLQNNAKKTISDLTAEECAKSCTTEMDFTCRSFDFCTFDTTAGSKIERCLLHTVNIAATGRIEGEEPVKWDQGKVICDHFSKKYVSDFKANRGQKLVAEESATFQSIPLESCAFECAEDGKKDCLSFEFCDTIVKKKIIRTCRLSPSEVTPGSLEKQEGCTVFGKIQAPVSVPESKGYSPGLVSFLTIFLLLLGVVIGLGGVAYYKKRQAATEYA